MRDMVAQEPVDVGTVLMGKGRPLRILAVVHAASLQRRPLATPGMLSKPVS